MIYTKTGDTGETGLFDGTRVSKADPRVEAYGQVDEVCAWVGLLRAETRDAPAELDAPLEQIQRDLFAVGARLADPSRKIAARVGKIVLDRDAVSRLERLIDEHDAALPPLRRFILPGGSRLGATLHVARTVCRRAERQVIALRAIDAEAVEPQVVVYLNRLSDLLFVLARSVNQRAGMPETEW